MTGLPTSNEKKKKQTFSRSPRCSDIAVTKSLYWTVYYTCVQIFLGLATCCSMLVSANKGSYNYGYGVNLPGSGQATSFSYKSSDHQSPIKIAAAAPQYYAAAVPDCDEDAPQYDLDVPAASISVTASPISETKIEANPVMYAARPEYLTASPAPLVTSRTLQDSVVQIQSTPAKIINPELILHQQSFSPQSTSFAYRSSAPQYYADAPAAPEYYFDAPTPIALRMVKPLVRDQSAPPTSSYQYNSLLNDNNKQPASSFQYRHSAASPVDYSAAYQPLQHNFVATAAQVRSSIQQFDDQEKPCEK